MNGSLFESPPPHQTERSGPRFTAHCDGGSRGNPGPAGYGAVIEDPQGQVVARLSAFLGSQTNNYAEYSGLLAVLKWAAEHGARRLRVVSDSELMVRQMSGQYKVTSPVLRPLWEEARRLARGLDSFEITHTLRGGNREADRLANEAMDRGMGKAGTKGPRDQGTQGSRERDTDGTGIEKQGTGNQGQPPGAKQNRGEPPRAPRQVLEGYVKDGVVHLLGGELPDGIFVKVVRE